MAANAPDSRSYGTGGTIYYGDSQYTGARNTDPHDGSATNSTIKYRDCHVENGQVYTGAKDTNISAPEANIKANKPWKHTNRGF